MSEKNQIYYLKFIHSQGNKTRGLKLTYLRHLYDLFLQKQTFSGDGFSNQRDGDAHGLLVGVFGRRKGTYVTAEKTDVSLERTRAPEAVDGALN